MATTIWNDFINGETLLSIRNKLNSFNKGVVKDIADLNTFNNGVTMDILKLNAKVDSIPHDSPQDPPHDSQVPPTYDYAKEGIFKSGRPIVITSNTEFKDVVRLPMPPRDAGVYHVTFSCSFKYSSAVRSAVFRWSMDGGTTWMEMWKEPKDTTNIEIVTASFPMELPTGNREFIIEARCEGADDTLTIDYGSITCERKHSNEPRTV